MELVETLVDRASALCGSRYALAKRLHASQGFLSDIARGKQPLPPGLAARLAEITGDDPKEAAAAAIVAQERNPGTRADLERLFQLSGKASLALMLICTAAALLHTPPAMATEQGARSSLYIM